MNNKGLLSLWLAFLLFFNSYRLIFSPYFCVLAWPFVDSMDRLSSLASLLFRHFSHLCYFNLHFFN